MELIINEPLNENHKEISLYGACTLEDFVLQVVPKKFTSLFVLRLRNSTPAIIMWEKGQKTPEYNAGLQLLTSAKDGGTIYLPQIESLYINEFEEECEILLLP